MKKIVILLLTVFTIALAAACGCGSSKVSNSYDGKQDEQSVHIQEVEIAENEENEQDGQKEPQKPECPDKEKRDGKFPAPRKPHRRHDGKIPHHKPEFRK